MLHQIKSIMVLGVLLSMGVVSAQTYVITNAKVHTLGDLGTLPKASVLIVDGEIVDIAEKLDIPADATVIDGAGKIVTPGIFDPYSYLGLVEVGAEDNTVDNSQSMNYGPAFKVIDGFNPRSSVIQINRMAGITRALIVPDPGQSGQVIAGTASVVHFGGNEQYRVKEQAAMVAFLGETGASMSGGSRATAMLRLKETLNDAIAYRDNQRGYDSGNSREFSLGKSDLDAMQGVISGSVPLLIYADRVSDIEAAIQLAAEFDLKVVINGGAEAWVIAKELAAAGIGVILNPIQNLPDQFESLNASLQNARKLNNAGVTIAFSFYNSHNARNLTQVAGNAVANGLPWDEALRAITLNPAKLLGIEQTCCVIEPGAIAELVVWDGDPLDVTSEAAHVFAAGKAVSMKSRQTMLRDRYLNLDDALPFAYRK